MRAVLAVSLLLMAVGCSSPAMFKVDVDEPVARGTLILNGRSANLMKNVDGAYWGKWNGGDADGRIQIAYPDSAQTVCKVGYTTNRVFMSFEVRHRSCRHVSTVIN